jgi:AcrR family transcriptional regulator
MSPTSTPRAGLDRETVIQTAARIIKAEGAETLTINRLARELGVKPPSLYNHIEGLAVLNITILGDRISKASIGKSGPAGIRALAQAYRDHIKECSGLYLTSLRASGNMEPPDLRLQAAEDRVVQVALAMIESFGLSGEEAVHAVRALRSMIHGFATLEAAGGFGLPISLDESFDRLVGIFILGTEHTHKGK